MRVTYSSKENKANFWIWKQFLQDCADTNCELSEKAEAIILSHRSDHLNRRLFI